MSPRAPGGGAGGAPTALAGLAATLFAAGVGCGGSGGVRGETETVPEPAEVASLPPAAEGETDVETARDAESRTGDAERAAAPTAERPERPRPDPEAESKGGGVFGRIRASSSGSGGAGPSVEWRVTVDSPGRSPRTVDPSRAPFDERIAGWRCRLGAFRVQRHLRLRGGRMQQQGSSERSLVCTRGEQRKEARASCRWGADSDPDGGATDVASVELDDDGRPVRVQLRCRREP